MMTGWLLSAFILTASADDLTLTLTITATGFRDTDGQAVFWLYDPENWLEPSAARRTATALITGAAVTATFTGVPPSRYGVAVLHDTNKNGTLDMRWFPIPGPAEGSGVSNDAPALIGPPRFADAALILGTDAEIQVTMRY
ncbi:MAG: hypothetical protein ACI8S6_002694 [Myxococcota bacterium]|jgi:uncharacterized protein (DUF2141 family)